MRIRPFQIEDTASVVHLWTLCGLTRPWNNPHADIQRKLSAQPDGFFVGLIDGQIIASIMAGYDGHRGWINYLAVAPQHQKRGFGRQLMQTAEQHLLSMDCPKINLQIRNDNTPAIAFYRSIGFVADEVASYGKRLIHDDVN